MMAATMTRKAVAELLDVHPDSVSRLVAAAGLASAVVGWGGRSKAMVFRRDLVERWAAARACPARVRTGRPCRACALVLEDAQAVAEHLLEVRHGAETCAECTPPGRLCQPCARGANGG